jgi:dual specificity phosphatase 12
MKAKGVAVQDALRVLQARVPAACPNPGFMAQLELWGEMGCQIAEDHAGYKQYLLAKVGQQHAVLSVLWEHAQ